MSCTFVTVAISVHRVDVLSGCAHRVDVLMAVSLLSL